MDDEQDDRQQMTDEQQRREEEQKMLKADPTFLLWLDSINQHHKEQIQCP